MATHVKHDGQLEMTLEILNPKIEQKNLQAYEIEEVLATAKAYFKGDELAANVWMNKYALKDSSGNIYERSPDEMHKRLAR